MSSSRRDLATAAGESDLLKNALDPALTEESCDLDRWFREAGVAFGRQVHGHAPQTAIPERVMEPGPLREAAINEFSFRALAEEAATRGIARIVQCAPTLATMDFYATQLLDEARHAYVFRWHLIELGLPRQTIDRELARLAGEKRARIISPLERLLVEHGEAGDFVGAVIVVAVIAEGALAPAAEMSERKWRMLNPPAAEISRGANLDETRHLAVGSSIVHRHLQEHPRDKTRLEQLIRRGMHLWTELPLEEALLERETLFQAALEQHRDLLEGYELVPGRPLAETTARERMETQEAWSLAMRRERLAYMGLDAE